MLKKVVITVDKDAGTNTDYVNFEGASCLSTSRQFHALLTQFGVQVEQTHVTPKPELLAALETQQEVPSYAETSHEVAMEE